MRLFYMFCIVYALTVGTIAGHGQIQRQAAQDKELHDFRSVQIQLQLLQMGARVIPEHKENGNEL